jgi:hypothetical protein
VERGEENIHATEKRKGGKKIRLKPLTRILTQRSNGGGVD